MGQYRYAALPERSSDAAWRLCTKDLLTLRLRLCTKDLLTLRLRLCMKDLLTLRCGFARKIF
jgi:hypothetical protein